MFALIVAVLVALGVLELYVLIQVGQAIGVLNTFGLLILAGVVGLWLGKREGFGVIARIRRRTNEGKVPADELIDAALILTGALLLIVPGFVSDVFGLLLLLPPTRAPVRAFVRRHLRIRVYGIDVQGHVERGIERGMEGLRRPPGDDPDIIDV
jgi:UPF0716 protein FxsA